MIFQFFGVGGMEGCIFIPKLTGTFLLHVGHLYSLSVIYNWGNSKFDSKMKLQEELEEDQVYSFYPSSNETIFSYSLSTLCMSNGS